MRRANKSSDSEILKQGLEYKKGGNNGKLRTLLAEEQERFCAYTGKPFTATEHGEIDHFNPQLKYTDQDSYKNWFLCVARWNRTKSSKWDNYQPVLSPFHERFEDRVQYYNGTYIAESEDTEAINLIALPSLNDEQLTKERLALVSQIRQLLAGPVALASDIREVLTDFPALHQFPRALRAEFPELEQSA